MPVIYRLLIYTGSKEWLRTTREHSGVPWEGTYPPAATGEEGIGAGIESLLIEEPEVAQQWFLRAFFESAKRARKMVDQGG